MILMADNNGPLQGNQCCRRKHFCTKSIYIMQFAFRSTKSFNGIWLVAIPRGEGWKVHIAYRAMFG